MKSLHEVVVRNRLEQLRKRQRDEALQAQEELLAGVARSASRRTAPDVPVEMEVVEEVVPAEDMEMYDRAMSPALIDITKLSADERDIDIVIEREDRQMMVRFFESNFVISALQSRCSSSSNVVLSLLLDLFPRSLSL